MRQNRGRDDSDSEYDSYEDDRRRSYSGRDGRKSHPRRRDGDIIEERRIVKSKNGRTRSVGRDGYGGARGYGRGGEHYAVL